jgi:Mce-associated membrane protein
MTTPSRAGWYPDPLKPDTQERRWDGEWTDETREAAVRDVVPDPPPPPRSEDLVEVDTPDGDPWEPPQPQEHSSRLTVVLVVAVVLLVAVGLLELAYFKGPLRDDPRVTSERPVLIDDLAAKSAVDIAAQAAVKFSERSYEKYDKQVDEAAAMMTTAYAEQFRQTTDEIKDEFVAAQTEVTVELEAQAVMSASEKQVQALIFLTQYTSKKDVTTTFTPFRIKVTLIKAGTSWLVSAVDTA